MDTDLGEECQKLLTGGLAGDAANKDLGFACFRLNQYEQEVDMGVGEPYSSLELRGRRPRQISAKLQNDNKGEHDV
jgi:hypothetical protein